VHSLVDRADGTGIMSEAHATPQADPGTLIRSKEYRRLLVVAALVGVVVSLASWAFLELLHWIQEWVYKDLPAGLGFDSAPTWWPAPVLLLAGLVTAYAVRLPGGGGHVPYKGLAGGVTLPNAVPGVLLAALASIGLGLVLGPEAPLIALGSGLAVFAVTRARRDVPDQAVAVIAASAAFAALATIFGSPIVGAVILIEAAGLGGAMLPLILLPGLMSAGIGSLVFIGAGSWTGLNNSDYSLAPFTLPSYPSPDFAAFAWTLPLSVAAGTVVFGIVQLARVSAGVVARKPWVLMPAAGVVVAVLAIAFEKATGQASAAVLFSGQDAFSSLLSQAGSLSLGTLLLLVLLKGIAWSVSLGSFRGGPTFPALFLGAAAGLMAAHLPGYSETPAVAALMAASTVSILRLPLSSVVITVLLTSRSGAGAAPIIIVAVVVAYITVQTLDLVRSRMEGTQSPAPRAASQA
jgi:H+/Cl- antiporter ClcA